MAKRGSKNKKIANSLVAVSSAAVLSVYAAGYARTRTAALKLEAQSGERRPPPASRAPQMARLMVVPAPLDPAAVVLSQPVVVPKPVSGDLPAPVAAPVTPHVVTPYVVTPHVEKAAPPLLPQTELPTAAPAIAETPLPPPLAAAPLPPPPPAPLPPPKPAAPTWKDGTYTGWGTSRHGNIQASVVIEGGRIASATIAQCLTRYSCDVIDKLPPQVAKRQSPEVDYVSGATQSADAFYFAVVEALGKAK